MASKWFSFAIYYKIGDVILNLAMPLIKGIPNNKIKSWQSNASGAIISKIGCDWPDGMKTESPCLLA